MGRVPGLPAPSEGTHRLPSRLEEGRFSSRRISRSNTEGAVFSALPRASIAPSSFSRSDIMRTKLCGGSVVARMASPSRSMSSLRVARLLFELGDFRGGRNRAPQRVLAGPPLAMVRARIDLHRLMTRFSVRDLDASATNRALRETRKEIPSSGARRALPSHPRLVCDPRLNGAPEFFRNDAKLGPFHAQAFGSRSRQAHFRSTPVRFGAPSPDQDPSVPLVAKDGVKSAGGPRDGPGLRCIPLPRARR
jgi:hypothetical protein